MSTQNESQDLHDLWKRAVMRLSEASKTPQEQDRSIASLISSIGKDVKQFWRASDRKLQQVESLIQTPKDRNDLTILSRFDALSADLQRVDRTLDAKLQQLVDGSGRIEEVISSSSEIAGLHAVLSRIEMSPAITGTPKKDADLERILHRIELSPEERSGLDQIPHLVTQTTQLSADLKSYRERHDKVDILKSISDVEAKMDDMGVKLNNLQLQSTGPSASRQDYVRLDQQSSVLPQETLVLALKGRTNDQSHQTPTAKNKKGFQHQYDGISNANEGSQMLVSPFRKATERARRASEPGDDGVTIALPSRSKAGLTTTDEEDDSSEEVDLSKKADDIQDMWKLTKEVVANVLNRIEPAANSTYTMSEIMNMLLVALGNTHVPDVGAGLLKDFLDNEDDDFDADSWTCVRAICEGKLDEPLGASECCSHCMERGHKYCLRIHKKGNKKAALCAYCLGGKE
ncbi:hypothetical protein UCREL1_9913 [Eutypa lata UCREL1]|uniref:Uncharacterized protein n=1 Tax=Eutypa lata (strain UCR-EL1) TaxID=1287681 RepID=M7SFZ5_EUTLA|nr:hypothetical protein UCREL1_9913 [Eutypa lata UCREL1]